MTNSPSPSPSSHSVSIWEVIGITFGALVLILAGSARLGWKYLSNISDPVRSEAIASSLLDYQIPGGSRGVLGINIGGAQIALVASQKKLTNTSDPKIQIIVAKIPINPEARNKFTTENIEPRVLLDTLLGSQFQAESREDQNKEFCGEKSSMVIEKGQQTLSNGETKVSATQYTLKTVVGNYERQVIIIAVGDEGETEAKKVIDNLKCLVKKS